MADEVRLTADLTLLAPWRREYPTEEEGAGHCAGGTSQMSLVR